MEVMVRKGAVELKDGAFHIRDYFRDKLSSSAQAKEPETPETQHSPTKSA